MVLEYLQIQHKACASLCFSASPPRIGYLSLWMYEGLSSPWFITPRGISATRNMKSRLAIKFPTPTRWSGDVMKRPGHKNFNAVSHNRSRPEVLSLNLTWRSRGPISSVLLQLLLFTFSNRKFGRHGKWSVTFWQWENNTKDRTWLWDTALNFFDRVFSLCHQITWQWVVIKCPPPGRLS